MNSPYDSRVSRISHCQVGLLGQDQTHRLLAKNVETTGYHGLVDGEGGQDSNEISSNSNNKQKTHVISLPHLQTHPGLGGVRSSGGTPSHDPVIGP